jgi:hypothetical protein
LALRPFSASSPTPGISNSDDEIAAGLGRAKPLTHPHYKTLSRRMRRQGLFLWTWEFTTAQCRITISAPNLRAERKRDDASAISGNERIDHDVQCVRLGIQ